MRLSLKTIEICRRKYGKGDFYGFDQMNEFLLEDLVQEDVESDFEELLQNGILEVSEDEIHFNALGHHIFNMMITPEQYIVIENGAKKMSIRIYVRNAYYLCVIEDQNIRDYDDYNKYKVKLLPDLNLVVGAFVHGLNVNGTSTMENNDISIRGKAWNKGREVHAEMEINGYYDQETVCYQRKEIENGLTKCQEEAESDVSELVNALTKWLFDKIAVINESEVC